MMGKYNEKVFFTDKKRTAEPILFKRLGTYLPFDSGEWKTHSEFLIITYSLVCDVVIVDSDATSARIVVQIIHNQKKKANIFGNILLWK